MVCTTLMHTDATKRETKDSEILEGEAVGLKTPLWNHQLPLNRVARQIVLSISLPLRQQCQYARNTRYAHWKRFRSFVNDVNCKCTIPTVQFSQTSSKITMSCYCPTALRVTHQYPQNQNFFIFRDVSNGSPLLLMVDVHYRNTDPHQRLNIR